MGRPSRSVTRFVSGVLPREMVDALDPAGAPPMPDILDPSPWLIVSDAEPPMWVVCWIWGPDCDQAIMSFRGFRFQGSEWIAVRSLEPIRRQITHYRPIPRPEPPITGHPR